MSSYPYTNSFQLIRSILILIDVFGIIGSISQLVSGLFKLANAQDESQVGQAQQQQQQQQPAVGEYRSWCVDIFAGQY